MSIEPANLCVTTNPIGHKIHKTPPSTVVEMNGENGEVML